MIYPAIDDIMQLFDSRYVLVSAVAKRARQLSNEGEAPLVILKSKNYVTVAATEVYKKKILYRNGIEK